LCDRWRWRYWRGGRGGGGWRKGGGPRFRVRPKGGERARGRGAENKLAPAGGGGETCERHRVGGGGRGLARRAAHDSCIVLECVVLKGGVGWEWGVEETRLGLWQRNMDILATGYFLVSRESFRLMKRQNIGGAIIFVASKNGLVASPGASAYCVAKASEIHLA